MGGWRPFIAESPALEKTSRVSASAIRSPACMPIRLMRKTRRAKTGREEEVAQKIRTIDTHTHVLADATIKLLQKEIPKLGLEADALSTTTIASSKSPACRTGRFRAAATISRGGLPTWTRPWSTCRCCRRRRRPGSTARKRPPASRVGDPERRHGAAHQGASGSLRRHRHAADAGAATRPPTNCAAP